MSYRDDEPSGTISPCIAILLAMAGLIGAVVSNARPVASVRVWVPVQSNDASSGWIRSTSPCLAMRAGCNPSDPV
jgi:hypothetical protein